MGMRKRYEFIVETSITALAFVLILFPANLLNASECLPQKTDCGRPVKLLRDIQLQKCNAALQRTQEVENVLHLGRVERIEIVDHLVGF